MKMTKPITEFDQAVVDNFEAGFDKFGRARNRHVLQMAEEGTYTNELTGIFKRIGDLSNEYPFIKQIIPFTRTPMNLMLNVVDRTPLGFARKQFRDEFFSPDRNIRAAAYGKQLMGTSLFTMGGILAYNGIITGGIPKDKNLRRQKFDTGWRPYSFKLGLLCLKIFRK